MSNEITYKWLFAYLGELGFEETLRTKSQRVFEQPTLDVLLAFSILDDAAADAPVRAADITSVEFRLQQNGLLTGTLVDIAAQRSES